MRYLAADGVQALNYPVVHGGEDIYSLPVADIRVDYETDWVVRTERALEAAYGASAFFEYYRDGLFDILDSHPERMIELNTQITRWLLVKFGIPAEIRFTDHYIPEYETKGMGAGWHGQAQSEQTKGIGTHDAGGQGHEQSPESYYGRDLRNVIHPKRESGLSRPLSEGGLGLPIREYYQPWRSRFGFVPGLSALDLLFNEGPNSIYILTPDR